jgi:hypothetical protein
LRAKRSNPASFAAASKLDCFVAFAPRNDGDRTYALILTACFSPELCKFIGPLKSEGAGKARRRLRPQSAVCNGRERTHTGLTGTAETSQPSPREWFYGLYVLSPVSGVCCHRCTPRTGGTDRRHGRGARTTRFRRPPQRFAGCTSHLTPRAAHRHPRQRIVAIMMRPSGGTG